MAPNTAVNSPTGEGPGRSEAYFSSPELAQRTDLLRHLTENSNLIPLVRGVEGIGKSTFIKHLLDLAPGSWIPAQIVADVMLQPEALLAKLAGLYDLDVASDGLIERLALRFDDLRQDGFLPVIIIDDAHLLPEATVITLLRLHEAGPSDNPPVQILLFAQPEINNLLSTPQLKVMNLQSLQLLDMPLFSKEQTQRFLEHLLSADPSAMSRPLSPLQLDKIYRETRGMPDLIKQQAVRLMESGEKRKSEFNIADITELVPPRAAIGGGLVMIVVLLGLVFQDSINSMFSGDGELPELTQESPVMPGKTQQLAIPESLPEESEPDPEQPSSIVSELVSSDSDMDDVGEELDAEQSVEALPESEQAAATPGEEATIEQPDSTPEAVEQAEPVIEPAAETAIAPELAEVPEPEPVQQQAPEPAPVPEQKQTPAEKEPVEQVVATEPDAQASKESVAEATDKPKKKVAAKPAKQEQAAVSQEKSSPPQQVKKKEVQVKPKPAAPKSKKPAQQVAAKKAPAKKRVKIRIPAVPSKKAAPVVQAEGGQRGLAREPLPIPAPVEDRSTLLAKPDVPAVKLPSPAKVEPKRPATPKKKPAPRPKTVSAGTKREDWLLKQKSSSYTIQLVGLQEEKGVKKFLRRHKVSGPIAYYRTKRSGKQWFPVLFGVFPDRNKALQARNKLPENLRKSGPWLRTLGSVQKDIRAQ